MSVVEMRPIEDLERDVARAERAYRSHRGRCRYFEGHGLDCDRCSDFLAAAFLAEQRLEAARSQVPERTIPSDGAWERRAERDYLEAVLS